MKSYTLHPDWKDQFFTYLLGYMLIPLFGLGLAIISSAKRHQRRIRYVITDNDITFHTTGENITLPLADVNEVTTQVNWLESILGIGKILLQVNNNKHELRGITDPGQLERMLRIAISTDKERQQQKAKVKGDFPDLNAGSVDKINTLVGLWQQGLIDDEEYQRERKKF